MCSLRCWEAREEAKKKKWAVAVAEMVVMSVAVVREGMTKLGQSGLFRTSTV
jgi:hypothetical protein